MISRQEHCTLYMLASVQRTVLVTSLGFDLEKGFNLGCILVAQ